MKGSVPHYRRLLRSQRSVSPILDSLQVRQQRQYYIVSIIWPKVRPVAKAASNSERVCSTLNDVIAVHLDFLLLFKSAWVACCQLAKQSLVCMLLCPMMCLHDVKLQRYNHLVAGHGSDVDGFIVTDRHVIQRVLRDQDHMLQELVLKHRICSLSFKIPHAMIRHVNHCSKPGFFSDEQQS